MTHLSLHKDEWKWAHRPTTTDHLNISFMNPGCIVQNLLRVKTCGWEGGGKHPSLFLSASQMEKQFITLSDSLSKTDMIKHNIKWIMFSSDWYHCNCQPDFCQSEMCTNKNAHIHFVGMGQTHRSCNFMPVWLSNMSPLPAPDGSTS